jgi:hypothetical protein
MAVAAGLKDRFNPLKKYLQDLAFEDLAYLSEEDLTTTVAPEDKLLMVVLIREHLYDYLNKPKPFSTRMITGKLGAPCASTSAVCSTYGRRSSARGSSTS